MLDERPAIDDFMPDGVWEKDVGPGCWSESANTTASDPVCLVQVASMTANESESESESENKTRRASGVDGSNCFYRVSAGCANVMGSG